MSNLDFPIAAIKTLLRSVSTATSLVDKQKHIDGLNRGLKILLDEKMKDDEQERDLKKLKDDHDKAVDDKNISYIKRG